MADIERLRRMGLEMARSRGHGPKVRTDLARLDRLGAAWGKGRGGRAAAADIERLTRMATKRRGKGRG